MTDRSPAKRTRVVFFIETMTPQCGGPAVEIARLTAALSRDPTLELIICSTSHDSESIRIGSNVVHVQLAGGKGILGWLKNVIQMRRLFSNSDYLFVSGIWGPLDGLGLKLAMTKNTDTFIRVCGMLEPYILSKNKLRKTLAFRLYVASNLRNAKGVIVNSAMEHANVVSVLGPNVDISIIRNGLLDFELGDRLAAKEHLGIRPDILSLLYLGRIDPKKGLHQLLKGINLIPQSRRNFKLVVAGAFGNDEYKRRILDMVECLGLSNTVCFSGLVRDKVKDKHFLAADAFILPTFSEGLPNAIVEALAYGLPVITTTGANVPEIEKHCAGLVTTTEPIEIKDTILFLMENRAQLSRYSTNARLVFKKYFSMEESERRYRDLLGLVSR